MPRAPSQAKDFTSVQRIDTFDPTIKPFEAQALIGYEWRTIGQADSRATAEVIARGYRIDHRGARTRVAEQRRPGGFAYIAV